MIAWTAQRRIPSRGNMRRMKMRLICLFCLLSAFATAARAITDADMAAALQDRAALALDLPDAARWRTQVPALYAARSDAPLWLKDGVPTPAALALLAELRAAEVRGLDSADYAGNRLLLAAGELAHQDASLPLRAARFDVELSVRAARFMTDLHAGRIDPRRAGHDLDVPHAALDLPSALNALANTGDARAVLDDFEPALRHYDLLRRSLDQYRELAAQPELNALPPLRARSIKPGERYGGAPALRQLLLATHDMASADGTGLAIPALASATDNGDLLDDSLVAGIQSFQRRHGLTPDGSLGARTFAELTTPFAHRVKQIEWSLERARWLPPRLATPPILVNIPQFKLFGFYSTEDREDAILQMNVIVGKTFQNTNTPVFAADMRFVVLRPYWDVPASILARELLPKIHANPGYLTRNHFELVLGQGDDGKVLAATPDNIAALARGALRLRQQPGADNSLGLAKFMFPNSHNVYLHGTPAQSLFGETRRAFSHGCIRIEDPRAFAAFVLRDDPSWNRERIDKALLLDSPTRINLAKSVRVFIIYATALATESGRTLFFEDIYGHDHKLEALLAARTPMTQSVHE